MTYISDFSHFFENNSIAEHHFLFKKQIDALITPIKARLNHSYIIIISVQINPPLSRR
jgi:hypothetical protein